MSQTFYARFFAIALLMTLPLACVSSYSLTGMPPKGQERCDFIIKRINWDDAIQSLNRISLLFYNHCYDEVVNAGQKAREIYKHKNYSLIKESMEVFLPEGAVTDYVMESYERGYLSLMVAMAYQRLKNQEAYTVELNRFYNEETAMLYNRGQDPVNALLQAVMWENIPREGYSSRPFWQWLATQTKVDPLLQAFAKTHVENNGTSKRDRKWKLYALGRFPQLDWSMSFQDTKSGYFTIRPKRSFIKSCAGAETILLPTRSWFEKVAIRHHHSYHPLVNVKSWIRLPVGAVYGISTVVAGAGVVVSGCAISASDKSLNSLCRFAIEGGVAIMAKSDEVIEAALQPDLRHWEEVPEAFFVSRSSKNEASTCWAQVRNLGYRSLQ